MDYIDLRSDTVTMPTDEMRKAMACAEVGDDAYGDDPTVKRLEAMAAERVGKEAALFVPTGTFGNQLAIFTHTLRGQEIIAGRDSHVVLHEVGSSAVIAGVQIRTVSTCGGELCAAEVETAVQKGSPYDMGTGLICVENAHGCGKVVSIENMRDVYLIAGKFHVPVHLDGARIFNAAAYLKVDVTDIAAYCDSVMFCLAKGLSAPVGSILAGSRDFIKAARKKESLWVAL